MSNKKSNMDLFQESLGDNYPTEYFKRVLGEDMFSLLFPDREEEEFKESLVQIVAMEAATKCALLCDLDFEKYGDEDDFYGIWEVKVILKRLRVLGNGIGITIPTVLLILLISGPIGQVVENLDLMLKDAMDNNSSSISLKNCSAFGDSFPKKRG